MTRSRALFISVVIGLLAVFFVRSYVSGKEAELLRLSTPVDVLVAAQDIPEGARLQDGMLEVISVPKKFVQPDVLQSLDEARDRLLTVSLLRGTQLMGSMLALNQDIGLAQQIPENMQAVTVSVNSTSGHAGLIQPGDFVDVAVTVEVLAEAENADSDGNAFVTQNTESMTKTILNNVMVLAVGQRSHRSRSANYGAGVQGAGNRFFNANASSSTSSIGTRGTSTVTLVLDDDQVLPLTLAQEIGDIALSLRSAWSDSSADENQDKKEIGSYELLGIDRPVVRDPVDVFYGARRTGN